MPDHDMDELLDEEEIEAYCVNCKQMTVMLNPTPVWTRKGAAATRGECDICGTTVFRMGRTAAHARLKKPDFTQMFGETTRSAGSRKGSPRFAAYINYAQVDASLAAQIAGDLDRIGIATWFDPHREDQPDSSQWASGVHPGLAECSHMVVVLSGASARDGRVADEWRYFRQERKPVVVAQVERVEVPDELRSRPRFDFAEDYKMAFRGLSQALFEGR